MNTGAYRKHFFLCDFKVEPDFTLKFSCHYLILHSFCTSFPLKACIKCIFLFIILFSLKMLMITKFALEYVLKTHWIMALQNFL